MPRKSKKKQLEEKLMQVLGLRMLAKTIRQATGQQLIVEDNLDFMYSFLYIYVKENRYISRKAYRTGLSRNILQDDLLSTDEESGHRPFLNDHEFLQKYRMSRRCFWKLVSLIEEHPVFDALNKGPKQAQPSFQILVFLKYIGTEGSGNSNPDLRNMFCTGRGTNEIYKRRVVKAILSISDQYFSWPDEAERKVIARRIQAAHHLPNCVGFADGTLNPLAMKPQTPDCADYYGRKHGYSLSTMVICDDTRKIRYYIAGWPGSCHDNRIYRNGRIASQPREYFSPNQYLLGDSAFEPSDYMVPAFKKPQGFSILREHENFNTCLARARVISEHTIGIWKARFPWLRNIRMIITPNKKSMKSILDCMKCTVILHNFLLDENESEVPDEWLRDSDIDHLDDNDELNIEVPVGSPNNSRQMQLMGYINELLY